MMHGGQSPIALPEVKFLPDVVAPEFAGPAQFLGLANTPTRPAGGATGGVGPGIAGGWVGPSRSYFLAAWHRVHGMYKGCTRDVHGLDVGGGEDMLLARRFENVGAFRSADMKRATGFSLSPSEGRRQLYGASI